MKKVAISFTFITFAKRFLFCGENKLLNVLLLGTRVKVLFCTLILQLHKLIY